MSAGTARFVVLAASCLAMVSIARAASPWSLMPQPVEAVSSAGQPVEIANGSTIEIRGGDRAKVLAVVVRFVKLVADKRGLQLNVADKDAHPAITFDVDAKIDGVGDACYRIAAKDGRSVVSARTPHGAFYG